MKTTRSPLKASALALALFAATAGAHAAVIEIGDEATGHTQHDIAIGNDARATGGWVGPGGGTGPAIAIGHGSRASAGDTIAIGAQASADSARSVAIGNYANTGPDAVALGHRAGSQQNGTSVGSEAFARWGGVAVGSQSETGSVHGTAVGTGATTNIDAQRAVALGWQSEATEAETVSVGNDTLKRRVVNVGFGENEFDAVIFQQVVPALQGVVSGLGGGASYDPATGVMTAPSYDLSVGSFSNVGDALVAIDGALGGGVAPQPNRYFKAVGSNNGSDDAQVVNYGDIAVGPNAYANDVGSIAMGLDARANTPGSIGIGEGAVADSSLDPDAPAHCSGAMAIGNNAVGGSCNATAIGYNAEANESGGLAIGARATVSDIYSTAVGTAAAVNGSFSAALGSRATVDHDYSVALGDSTRTTRDREVAIGNRVLGQVRAGTELTDGVNVGQIAPIADALGGGANFNGGVFTAPVYNYRDGTTHRNVGSGLDNLDARVWDLENADNGGTGEPVPGPQGPQGERGLDGRSAYQVAVENGYDGSEQDWLESLHGRDGVDGRDGRDGVGGGSTVKPGTNIEVADNADNTQSVYLSDTVELSEQGSVSVGGTRVDAQGVHIQGGASMTRNGIHAGNQRITGVAPGRIEQGSMDAINGGQMWEFKREMDDRWDVMDERIDAMGAQSAALSMMNGASTNLPVGKVAASVGWGQYGSKSAFAIGAKARLSERSSLNLGFSYSNGKAMGGVGYSIIID